MLRLVLFDIDGTLIRTGGAGVKAFAKVFETEFNAVDGFERLKFAGRTDVGLVREFFSFHDIPATPENFSRFFERYVFWLDQMIRESTGSICAGVLDFINTLKKLPEPPVLGLLTGNVRLGAEIKLRRFGLWDIFQTGGFADDHEERNKIAAVARSRGSRLIKHELKDSEVLVIGDTPHDISCGRFIRAQVLAVATGAYTLPELKLHTPDWVVENLTQINPDALISDSAVSS
jgi:phosphoglycolate phosphatase-like HAD superfamily hydrolase